MRPIVPIKRYSIQEVDMIARRCFMLFIAATLLAGAAGCSQTFNMNLKPTAIQAKSAPAVLPVFVKMVNPPVDSFVFAVTPIGAKKKMEMKNIPGRFDELLKQQIEQALKNRGYAIASSPGAARGVLTVDFHTFDFLWRVSAVSSSFGQTNILIKNSLAANRANAQPAWKWQYQNDAPYGSMWGNCYQNGCAFISGITIIGAIPFLIYLKARREPWDYLSEAGNIRMDEFLKQLETQLPRAEAMRGRL